jgi:hypothetical protein
VLGEEIMFGRAKKSKKANEEPKTNSTMFTFGITKEGTIVDNPFCYYNQYYPNRHKEPHIWYADVCSHSYYDALALLRKKLKITKKVMCKMGFEHNSLDTFEIPSTFGYKKCELNEWHKLGDFDENS